MKLYRDTSGNGIYRLVLTDNLTIGFTFRGINKVWTTNNSNLSWDESYWKKHDW